MSGINSQYCEVGGRVVGENQPRNTCWGAVNKGTSTLRSLQSTQSG